MARIVKTIEVYDDFCHENNSYEEHDFGSFEAEGHTIFFKIDYYDPTLTVHSTDPSDPLATKRVLPSCWPRNIEESPAHNRLCLKFAGARIVNGPKATSV